MTTTSMIRIVKPTFLSLLALAVLLALPANLTLATTSGPLVKSTPRLSSIMPRGVRRGGEHKLRFSGARLAGAEEVFLYDEGISVTKIEQVNANVIDVTVNVAETCRIGEHVAQVRTRNGISDYRSFFVGRLPEVAETEPNNSLGEGQPIEMNVTVTGIVTTEDIDYFKVVGKKGDRLSAEVQAMRLGYLFDPAIALLDKNRFELAVSDDSALTKQDSYFSVVLPEDGEYFISVREASFGGNGGCQYRLHVGHFPRPAAVYPAGGKRGSELEVEFIDKYVEGQPVRTTKQKIKLAEADGFRGGIFPSDDLGESPTPMPFRLSDFENVLEQEPNNGYSEVTSVATLPIALNGIISEPNDRDMFKFTAKKGQVWHVECYSRRIGSELDPVVNIFSADKKSLVGNDDARKNDSYIRFQAPADGEYYVRVMDHLRRGQPDFVYRLEIAPPTPKLSFGIRRIDRYSQQRQNISVPQGGRFAVLVDAARVDFAGEVSLIPDNLPLGVRMSAPPMHRNLNTMPVVFEVDENAPIGGKLIDFQATHKLDENRSVTGSFRNLADFALGQPNNALYYGCTVDKLPFAVVEKLPFKLELVSPKVPLVRNGKIAIKVIAHRDEGFDAPINLQFPFRSPGVGTTYQITLPKGQSEISYPLNANGNAMIGKWPMYVIGTSSFKGPAWASTQMGELEIAAPLVTAAFERVSIVRGESTQLICKLAHLTPFEGEAKAEILGIPPNITIDTPKTFTKDTKEIVFNVSTNEKSPFGKHGGLFCQITITKNGEPIVSRAGNAILQINKPKPPKKTASTQPVAKAK
ncbi:MAG: PPC domain-containing protein [Planctomycetota bacterium]